MESAPDPVSTPAPSTSLGGRALARLAELTMVLRAQVAAVRVERRNGLLAAALALMIVAIPLSIWIGARWLEAGVLARNAEARRALEPREAAAARALGERTQLADLLDRPSTATLIEQLASVLPADARIVRLSRDADGLVTLEVMTPDPAELRAALRGDPHFAALRTRGERRIDAAMIVTLSGRPS